MGSKKSIMKKIFFDKNKAFYKSVKHFPVAAIPSNEWAIFIKNGFNQEGIDIDDESIEKILAISKGFPYYTQQIAYELFNTCNTEVDEKHIKETVNSILNREEDLFLQEWGNLSQYQKKALKLIIKVQGEKLYSSDAMEQFDLNSSNLKKAIDGLIHKDVIDKYSSNYYLQDPMFEYYIQERLMGLHTGHFAGREGVMEALPGPPGGALDEPEKRRGETAGLGSGGDFP